MLCEKCWDHHDPGPCPPVWEACALVACTSCGNSFPMARDALFGFNRMVCGQCRMEGHFEVRPWTDEAKRQFGWDEGEVKADGIFRA